MIDHHLLARFLKGDVTREERDEVMQWLENQPEDWLERFMDEHWSDAGPVMEEPSRSEKIGRVLHRVSLEETRSRPSSLKRIMRVAAILTGLLVMSTAVYYLVNQREAATVASIQVKVPFSKTEKVILPDRSTITLNAGSILTYPERFSGDTREITLEGEAFFDVKADPSKPFIIHAGGLNTTVLGTTFNVAAYRQAQHFTITVLTGKVAVSDTLSRREVTLLPKQRVSFNTTTAEMTTSLVERPEQAIAWSEGRLIFEETSLAEVAERLSFKYGVEIILINKQLANCRFNGEFEHESLDDILTIITTLTKTKIKREGNTIQLSGKGC